MFRLPSGISWQHKVWSTSAKVIKYDARSWFCTSHALTSESTGVFHWIILCLPLLLLENGPKHTPLLAPFTLVNHRHLLPCGKVSWHVATKVSGGLKSCSQLMKCLVCNFWQTTFLYWCLWNCWWHHESFPFMKSLSSHGMLTENTLSPVARQNTSQYLQGQRSSHEKQHSEDETEQATTASLTPSPPTINSGGKNPEKKIIIQHDFNLEPLMVFGKLYQYTIYYPYHHSFATLLYQSILVQNKPMKFGSFWTKNAAFSANSSRLTSKSCQEFTSFFISKSNKH